MRILITTDILSSIRDNEECKSNWNVDRIMSWGTDINDSLHSLPNQPEDITFLIPTVINANNALAYDGANLALRILFKYIYNHSRGVGIVLLGFESREAFLSHYSYPNILKIPGITYSLFNRKIVYRISTNQPALQRSQYKSYIENLGLVLPSSFKSTHSLTNEWSIYKWASYIGMTNVKEQGGLDLLYFDYIKAIEKINSVKQKSVANNPKLINDIQSLKAMSSKILLVDDNVGWHSFFKEIFKDSEIQFEAIGEDFKKREFEDVLRIITDKVDSFAPDVILLDFRLLEDKDANSDFREISGTKILQKLKGKFDAPGKSYGRQILLFTATSRIENILRLKERNADGFILKEKPEYYASKEITKDSVSRMIRNIARGVERAKFLIPLNDGLTTLANISAVPDFVNDITLRYTIKTITESVRLLTQNNDLNEEVLKLVYLNLFAILESMKPASYRFINDFVQEKSPADRISLWENIDNLRNSLAHGDGIVRIDGRKEQISSSLIQNRILDLCSFIKEFIERHR